MDNYLKYLTQEENYTSTENGAITHKSSMNALLDLFGMGAAYRKRSDRDCILLFKNAFEEDPTYAMKCLFYLRDITEGQGERRFFRVICQWLADYFPSDMRRNLDKIPIYGRWDDLYIFVNTKLEKDAFKFMANQAAQDLQSKTPSLLGKWLKSENTSSLESRILATKTRNAFGLTSRQYRKMLSYLRKKIKVIETLMSAGKWDEIEFDKIPSKAGMIYRNAFARHDVERMKSKKQIKSYEDFIKNKNTKVNAKALYPYEVVGKAYDFTRRFSYSLHNVSFNDIERLAINKYWDNLKDYFNNCKLDALCVIDTSASMWGTPISVAISLGMYAAEKARGPFHGYYVSFSRRPQLVRVEGVDFVDKVQRIYEKNICENTNIEATFDMLLDTAINNGCTQKDLPKNIVIISDMEFDSQVGSYEKTQQTLMENIRDKWRCYGFKMPNLVFWNVDARRNNVPMRVQNGVTLVSGFSPVTFEMIMKGKTAFDLMMDKLNSARYVIIS